MQISARIPGLVAALAIGVGLAGGAAAEQGSGANDDARILGPYIGFGGSYGWATTLEDNLDDEIAFPPPITTVEVSGSGGFDSHFGWRFLPWLGSEIQLEYLPGFELRAQEENFLPSNKLAEQKVLTTTVNGKLTPFRWGGFEPFGIFGVGFLWSELDVQGAPNLEDSGTVFALRGGGGFDIYLYEPLALSIAATYVKPFGKWEDELDYVSVNFGLHYHFKNFKLPGR